MTLRRLFGFLRPYRGQVIVSTLLAIGSQVAVLTIPFLTGRAIDATQPGHRDRSALMLNVGMDIPFYVVFGSGGGVVVPVLLGGGLEYFLDRNLAVNFNVRMGPSVGSYSGFFEDRTRARFTLEALLGIAYKF